MTKSAKLVFFGTENFSLPSLKRLIDDGWDIQAVVTKPDSQKGRGRKLSPPAVKTEAAARGIEVLQPDRLEAVRAKLVSIGASHGILVAYGKIIPQDIIDIFPGGIINLHPSLLPKYRGPTPIEAAILGGDTETGLTLIKLIAKMDAGPIYAQREIPLKGDETRPGLSETLAEKGADFLSNELERIVSGETRALPQDESQASYTKLLSKTDGVVDWSKPAKVIEREVRAYLGFPKTRANIHKHDVILTKVRVAKDHTDGALLVPCGGNTYLEVLELTAPSGRTVSGIDFMKGYAKN